MIGIIPTDDVGRESRDGNGRLMANTATEIVYTSTVLVATLALFATSAVANPAAEIILKRQGMTWKKDGNDCSMNAGRACIARGGDNTQGEGNSPRFSDGNNCMGDTVKYTSKMAKGINDAGEKGFCTITMKTDQRCCVNGQCSAQEVARDRRVVKTTDAYTEETIQDVSFSKGCAKGTYIQSEMRLV
ncbi:hypothetical protein PG987_005143 [Apiospora arundinis]